MDENINLFDSLNHKTEKLVKQYKVLKEENTMLLNEQIKFKEEVNNSKKRIEKLNEEIRLLRITKSVRSDEESSELKNRIDKMVREIDKSLELLQNK